MLSAGKNGLQKTDDKGHGMKPISSVFLVAFSALALLWAAAFQLSCETGDTKDLEDAAAKDLTIEIDVVYPEGAVTEGFRPSVAVYSAEDYNDFSARPEAMPVAALLGEEGENFLAGFVMNFAQNEVYDFPPGEYSVVIGVAYATGMPSHVEGTPWLPMSVSLQENGIAILVEAEDESWRNE